MLEKLGFKTFAYDWREEHVPTFDAEIEALQRHGIKLLAWLFYTTDDPGAMNWKDESVLPSGLLAGGNKKSVKMSIEAELETFKGHNVHPQLWVIPLKPMNLPKPAEKMSPEEGRQFLMRYWGEDLPKTPQKQERRVKQEADRISALAKLAATYGLKVALYNHGGWFGIMDNQVAVINRLKGLGVTDVGIVYNFSHARDPLHDDTVNFPAIWKKIEPYVVAVNITGTHSEPSDPIRLYPSQGDRELEMMRTIQESGWRGPIGLIAERGGDAEITLSNDLVGLEWLAAELKQSGSGGPRPFR